LYTAKNPDIKSAGSSGVEKCGIEGVNGVVERLKRRVL